MTEITQELLKSLLTYDPDTGVFTRDGKIVRTKNTSGYIQISVKGRKYCAHKLAWVYVYGVYPDGDLDHINRIRDDNRIANLRIATRSLNRLNSNIRSDNTSGATRVSWRKRNQKWVVQHTIDGKRRAKMYRTLAEAINASPNI
jgi:hypothetical protein